MDKNEYLSIIEGMLFLSGDEGLTINQIKNVLDVSKKDATILMDELIYIYDCRSVKGIEIVNYGGIYKMVTLANYHDYYAKMINTSKSTLSNAALETLAIIAYNQPVTRLKVEEIRGVGCDAMIRKLVAKALIKEVGREDSPGKPILYSVTDEFMDVFGLVSLDELPELEEITNDFDEEDLFNTQYREELDE